MGFDREEWRDKIKVVFNIVANCECEVCGCEWDEECFDTTGDFTCPECGETVFLR